MSENLQIYNKDNPFLCPIKERFTLNKTGSKKNTQHVVLDLKGSGIHYHVGDCIGIIPVNDPQVVSFTLKALKASGDELVQEKNSDKQWSLRQFLEQKANLGTINRKLLQEITQKQRDAEKKSALEELFKNKEALKEYLETREVWDLMLEHQEVTFSPQEFCSMLMPLLPRFYSIASSKKAVEDEVHLTVASLKYEANGHERFGVCTRYILDRVELNQPIVPIYIQPHHGFTVPSDPAANMIMVGPGTGIAPFRGFMQERIVTGSTGQNWLFFGEWNRAHDFLYEDYWNHLQSEKKLQLDVAFSRDQEHKVYVQHRLLANGAEIFRWLENGAYFYVCGDAHNMAKDVDAALHHIVREHGSRDEDGAKQYVKQLRTDKRYLRDVY